MSDSPEWMKNPEALKHFKESLEKSGIPLEITALNYLRDKEYRSNSLYYSDYLHGEIDPKERTLRELDVYAYKTIHSFNIDSCSVEFNINLFLECKSWDNCSIVFFERDNKRVMSFPLIYQGKKMLLSSFKDYSIPFVVKNHAEVNTKEHTIIHNKSLIHDASNQLSAACNYMFKRKKQNIFPFKQLYEKYQKIHPLCDKKIIMDTYTEKEIINEIPIFNLTCAYNILVLDNKNEIIKAEFDPNSSTISNLDLEKFVLYPILPQKVDSYDELIGSQFEIPIFITNVNNLGECISCIETGFMKTAKQTEQILINHPHNLADMILDEVFNI